MEQQTTRFLYANPVNGSLQTGKVYPDSTNVLARDTNQAWAVVSGVDHMTYSYDWMGRLTGSTDQRGVVRVFLYDAAGRLVADVVTVLPDGVDGSVRRIGRTYTDAGADEKVTACSDPTGSVVTNEIAYRYDGWGNVTNVQQAHQGAVDVSAPKVRYEHEDGAVSGEARYVRLARLVYPSGQEVRYVYPTNGVGAKLARLAALTDTNGLAYVQYAYLGASTLSGKAFLMVTNTLVLSYGQDGSYSGWDTFGRVLDQKWTVGTQVVDRFQYVYDRGGRRIAKTVLPLLAADLDETYAYDNLNQLIRMDRSNGVNQVWDLEPAGNWAVFATNDVAQTREHNAANEMVAIDAATNALAHDAAGNMVRFPLPLEEGQGEGVLCTWDAWNQLMSVSTDGVQIAAFAYDGTQRRIRKETPAGASDFFYDGWNMVEERLAGGAAQVTNGYVWGLDLSGTMQGAGGIGGLVARCSLAGDSPAFYCADANGNVTALFADDGTNVARYVYDPYGTVVNRSGALADENMYRFSTKYTDDETGLVYYGYRYYSPGLGRWLSRDPITNLALVRRRLPTSSAHEATHMPWWIPNARTRNCRGMKNKQETPMELSLDGSPYSFFSRGQTQTDALGLYMQPNGCATSGGGLMLGCDSPQAPCMTSGRCVTRSGGVNFIEYESCLCCVEMTGWFDFGFCKKIKGRVMICYGPDPDANCYYRLLSIEAKRCCCPKGENCRSFSRCWRWEDRFR